MSKKNKSASKSTSKEKIDIKAMLMKKGEVVALGVCVLIMLVLLYSGLSEAMSSPEADDILKKYDARVQLIRSNQVNADPKNSSEPMPLEKDDPKYLKLHNPIVTVAAKEFETPDQIVRERRTYQQKRQQPLVFAPGELKAEAVLVPLRSISFIPKYDGNKRTITSVRTIKSGNYRSLLSQKGRQDAFGQLSGLGGFGNSEGSGGYPGNDEDYNAAMSGAAPSGSKGLSGPDAGSYAGRGFGRMGGMGDELSAPCCPDCPEGSGAPAAAKAEGVLEIDNTPIEKIEELLNNNQEPNYAEIVRPTPMIIVEGSFPFEAQVNEFAKKLLITPQQVISDLIVDEVEVIDEKGNKTKEVHELQAFDFRWYEVKRQVVLPNGTIYKRDPKNLADDGWYDLDYQHAYQQLMLNTNDTFVDDPNLLKMSDKEKVAFARIKEFSRGLAHELPIAWGDEDKPKGDKLYPRLAMELPTIKTALEKLQVNKDDDFTKLRKSFEDSRRNPYKPRSRKQRDPTKSAAGTGATGQDPNYYFGFGGAAAAKKELPPLPKHVLIRFIDVPEHPLFLVEGCRFRYKLRVKMNNPNYGRTRDDVFSDFTKQRFLYSPWVTMGLPTLDKGIVLGSAPYLVPLESTVRFPQKQEYYAVNQREVDDPKYPGFKYPDHQAAIQMHRYVPAYHGQINNKDGSDVRLVGEWLVADYVPVSLGEPLFKLTPSFVPYKPIYNSGYVLGMQKNPLRQKYKMMLEEMLKRKQIKKPDFRKKMALVKKIVQLPFGDASILADIAGGRSQYDQVIRDPITEEVRVKPVTQLVARELAIVRPDGRLLLIDDDPAHLKEDQLKEGYEDEKRRRARVKEWRDRIDKLKKKEKVEAPKVVDPGSSDFDPFSGLDGFGCDE